MLGGSSAIVETGCEVAISPPSSRKCEPIASAIRCEPPRASGQPNACAISPRTSPAAALIGLVSGIMECASHTGEQPSSPLGLEPPIGQAVRGAQPREPESRRGERMPRSSQGPEQVADDRVRGAGERPHQPAIALRIGSQALRRRLDGALQDRRGAVVERVGERGRRMDSSSPCSARGSSRRNGDPSAIGCIAEQTSWTKPGRVSSAERIPPPIVSFASSTSTDRPAPREDDGGGEAVGPRADDDRVVLAQAGALALTVPPRLPDRPSALESDAGRLALLAALGRHSPAPRPGRPPFPFDPLPFTAAGPWGSDRRHAVAVHARGRCRSP